MPRKGKRVTLDTNIYQDGSGISICVSGFNEQRYGLGTPLVLLQQVRNGLKKQRQKHKTSGPITLQRDCARYLKRKGHLANLSSVEAELDAWCALYGSRVRHTLTKDDVLDARQQWSDAGFAPKTINHRVNRLRALFHELDGPQAWTPTDNLRPLSVPRTPIQRITPQLVLNVLDRMATSRNARGRLRKPIARFLVYATTGRRPSEIARAHRADVDFDSRVWVPRDGKGGFTPGIYLNDDMLFAWRYFDEVNAWGRFNSRVFPRTLRRYGWPAGVRPYNLRHTIGITLSEAGFDLADIAPHMGHTKPDTTRKNYVPVLGSRLQRMSESIGDRLGLGVPSPRSIKAPETCPAPSENGEPTEGAIRAKNAK